MIAIFGEVLEIYKQCLGMSVSHASWDYCEPLNLLNENWKYKLLLGVVLPIAYNLGALIVYQELFVKETCSKVF